VLKEGNREGDRGKRWGEHLSIHGKNENVEKRKLFEKEREERKEAEDAIGFRGGGQ